MNTVQVALFFMCAILVGNGQPASATAPSSDEVVIGYRDSGGWLGVSVGDMTPELAEAMKSGTNEGALINDVVDNSPADSAGLRKEDIVVLFDSKEIADADDLVRAVAGSSPGATVQVTIVRDNARKSYQLVLGHAPRRAHVRVFVPDPPDIPPMKISFGSGTHGMSLQDLTEQLGEYFGTPKNEGVLVTEVEKESAAEKAGIRAGDVITRVGKQNIREIDDIGDELEEYEKGETVSIEVIRKGSTKKLTLEVDEERNHFRWFGPHGGMECGPDCRCGRHHGDLRKFELELDRKGHEFDEWRRDLHELEMELRDMGRSIKEKIVRKIRSVMS